MNYRAVLHDPDTITERPIQILGSVLAEVKRWAREILVKAKSMDSKVLIYETTEQCIEVVTKPIAVQSAQNAQTNPPAAPVAIPQDK